MKNLIREIGLIMLIAEFFDLRLLQELNPLVAKKDLYEEGERIGEDFPKTPRELAYLL